MNQRVLLILQFVISGFAALSAVVVVAVAVLVAPSHKPTIAWLTLFTGSVIAASLAFAAQSGSVLVLAVGSGLVTVLVTTRRFKRVADAT